MNIYCKSNLHEKIAYEGISELKYVSLLRTGVFALIHETLVLPVLNYIKEYI